MSPIPLGILALAGAAAGGPAYDLLSTTVLSSSASSVSFSSLDTLAAGYKHLEIRMVTRSDYSNIYNDSLHTKLHFNGDTGSNYAYHRMHGSGSSVSSSAATSTADLRIWYTTAVGNSTTGIFTPAVISILDFANASKNTTTRAINGMYGSIGAPRVAFQSGLWNNTAAVTSLSLTSAFGNYVAGSRFSLYGVRG